MIGGEVPEFDDLDPDDTSDRPDFELPDEATSDEHAEPVPSDVDGGKWQAASGKSAESASSDADAAEPRPLSGVGRRGWARAAALGPAARNGRNGRRATESASSDAGGGKWRVAGGKAVESTSSDAGGFERHAPRRGRASEDARSARVHSEGADDSLPTALAAAAAAAPDGEEAALLAAGLVPLALAAVEPRGRALRPALPALVKGIAALAMWLVEEDSRRHMRLLPLIVEETVRALDRAAAEGRSITRGLAGDALAEQTELILSRQGQRHRSQRRGKTRLDGRREDGRPDRPRPRRGGPPLWESGEWDQSNGDEYP